VKCLLCRRALNDVNRSARPMWALWTNILVLPTIGLAFALRYYEDIGAWALILGFAGAVYGMILLRDKTTTCSCPATP